MNKQGIGALALGVAAAVGLSACGGGGGSPGETHEQYKITLRADSVNLPSTHENASIFGPFETMLYVEATEGGRPVSDSDEVFSCRFRDGLGLGYLYYFDDDPEHFDDDDNAKPYKSIVLSANVGGNTFIFGAADGPGTATIICSITDPRDNRSYTDEVEIKITAAPASAAVAQ